MPDELELVRAVLADRPDDCPGVAKVRLSLLAAIDGERRGVAVPVLTVPADGATRCSPATALVVAAAVAAAAVVAAVMVPLVPGRSTPAGAAQVLQAAADQALSVTTPVPGPGQYYYTETVQKVLNGTGNPLVLYEHTVTVQLWATTSGTGREVFDYGQTAPATPAFQQLWETEGSHTLPGAHTFDSTFPLPPGSPQTQGIFTSRTGGGVPFADLATLPTDPSALEQHIVAETDHGDANSLTTFFRVGALLGEDGSPTLRAALFQVLASLPGIVNLGTVTAFNDQTATAVGMATTRTIGPTMQELLFDPSTSQIVEQRAVLTGAATLRTAGSPSLPAGFVVGETNYASSGIVSSTTATPSQSTT